MSLAYNISKTKEMNYNLNNNNRNLKTFKVTLVLLTLLSMVLFSCEEVEITPISETPSPVEGINYYRLKQVDFDGTESYHDIMSTQVVETSNANINARTLGVSENSTQSGSWSDNSTWTDGSAPSYSLGNGATINIEANHYIAAAGNLDFNNSATIIVKTSATLDVVSLFANNGSTLTIESGATLIIRGDLILNNNLGINVAGTLIVLGDVDINGGGSSDIVNTGNVYIVDPTPDFGGTNFTGSPLKDINDLANELPSMFATLPITIAWQQATSLNGGTVSIAFETSEEQNSDYVVIQWSVDAESWTDIAKLPSQNKPSYYEYFHR